MTYFQRENRDLVNVDGCDLLQSQFFVVSNFTAACALDYLAEVSEQILPASEPNEKFFRLLASVLDHMRAELPGAEWRVVTYFSLWAVKLSGFLPDLATCSGCGVWLEDPDAPERAFYGRSRPGLYCTDCRRSLDLRNAWEISAVSREIAREILCTPIAGIIARPWTNETAKDLRRFLAQQMELHIERRLITYPILEAAA